jgi:alcohol dehydrogenase YqhD (iron-dependent ADH family)
MRDFNYYAPTEVAFGKDITDEEIKEMVRKCSRDYTATCGGLKVLNAEDMENIYKMARG